MNKLNKKRFKKGLIIFGIIIIPLIYSFIYLKAFWDPYNELEKLPVALVNNDKCKTDCLGTKLIDKLVDSKEFKFSVVEEKEGREGLTNKKYYATITIPENFTKRLNNAQNKNRKQVVIDYRPNNKTNFLASQILSGAVTKIENELLRESTGKIVGTLSNKLMDVPNQTSLMSDAFASINSGTNSLKNGTKKLDKGTNKLNINYNEFNNGIIKLSDGVNELNTQSSSLSTLSSAIENKLAPSAKDSNNKATKYVTDVHTANAYVQSAFNSILQYASIHPEILDSTNPNYDVNFFSAYQIVQKFQNENTINNITNQEVALLTSTGTTNVIASSLASNAPNLILLQNGINTLNSNINTLKYNSNKINNGINDINNGTSSLYSGVVTLNNGVSTAKDEVDNKVNEAKKQTSALKGIKKYSKEPVKIKEKTESKINNYGTAFAPYFISLSLWVGGILILVGLYYDPERRFKYLGRDSDNKILTVALYALIGLIQAIILGLVLHLFLDFEITNIFLYYGSCMIISSVFLSIILFLFLHFKDVGKFLAIFLLVVQLAASNGTFPMETEPLLYRMIYPFMPMTYSVDLLKQSFVDINNTFLLKDILVLFIMWITFSVFTVLLGVIKEKIKTKSKKRNTKKK